MTVIAYRDGVMAADTAIDCRSTRVGTLQKITRAPDGTLVACCGSTAASERCRIWVASGMEGEARARNTGTVVALARLGIRPFAAQRRADKKARRAARRVTP